MNRRKLLTTSLSCTPGLLLHPSILYADQPESNAGSICSTDVGSVAERLFNQSATSDDDDDNDANESLKTWQGVARKDLIWRSRDVRISVNGVMHIAVGFVYDPGDRFKNLVIERANRWLASGTLSRRIKFVFDQPIDNCEIRVASSSSSGVATANASKLGRLAKNQRISKELDTDRKSTMIIHDPSSIEHEFGHALGLGHEHTHPRILRFIDMRKAEKHFSKHPNYWTPARTRRNFSATPTCAGDQEPNYASCMLYGLPEGITRNGVSLYDFNEIHERDRRCVESLYIA